MSNKEYQMLKYEASNNDQRPTNLHERSKRKAAARAAYGIRVIELGVLLAGPFCGQLLGDMGAEVSRWNCPGPATRSASGAANW
jgi:hypothetical protein